MIQLAQWIAWIVQLVRAPAHKAGDLGSNPGPGKNFALKSTTQKLSAFISQEIFRLSFYMHNLLINKKTSMKPKHLFIKPLSSVNTFTVFLESKLKKKNLFVLHIEVCLMLITYREFCNSNVL